MIHAKLLIFYEDRIDVLEENNYIDRQDPDNSVTYKCTTIEKHWQNINSLVEQCVNIGTHGLFVPGDNEYIPPHRIEKIKVDIKNGN